MKKRSIEIQTIGSEHRITLTLPKLGGAAMTVAISLLLHSAKAEPPYIIDQAPSKTNLAGGSLTLWVTAGGTPSPSYQWTSNSVPIAGSTRRTFTLTNATTSCSATYSCIVTNIEGLTNTQPIILTLIDPPPGYATAVMSDNPTAFWRLDEANGPIAADSAGFHDGTYSSSGVTYGVAGTTGAPGLGVRFDGSGRVIVPYSPALNPSNSFTVEFWAQPSAGLTNWLTPLSSLDRATQAGGYECFLGANYNGFEFHTGPGRYSMITGDDTPAASDKWYHVAGVFEGTSIYLYVNGQPASPDFMDDWFAHIHAPFTPNTRTDFYIGSASTNAWWFKGVMSSVAFYNHALSEARLRAHLASFGTIALAPGSIVLDSKPSGTPHNGINRGALWGLSLNDGTTTRQGIMRFDASLTNQITVAPNPDFSSATNGTIMFWILDPA